MKKWLWVLFGVIGFSLVSWAGEGVRWNVYPNPFEDYVAVEWQQNSEGNIRMMVFDLTGKMVKEVAVKGKIGSNAYIVEFEDLPSGPYNFYFHDPSGAKLYHGKILKR